jgi:membrane-associated protein
MLDWLKELHSPEGITKIISTGGLWALVAIIFAETGLLAGFFLPGDSLLITAGILANPGNEKYIPGFDIYELTLILTVAAILGDQLNFTIGRKIGEKIWERPDSRFYKRRHMERAHDFYVKHGALAIVAARWVPILRTFVPFAAGVAEMPRRSFAVWNAVGATAWIVSMLWAGYFLGGTRYAKRLDQIILIVIAVSFLPIVIGALKGWLQSRSAKVPEPGAAT